MGRNASYFRVITNLVSIKLVRVSKNEILGMSAPIHHHFDPYFSTFFIFFFY